MSRAQILTLVFALILPLGCSSSKKRDSESDEDPTRYYQRGVDFLHQGRPDRAAAELEEAVAIASDNAFMHNTLGLAYLGMRDFARAQATFERVLEIDPYFTDAHNNLGIVFIQSAQPARAMIQFQAALADKRYRTPEVARYNIGVIHLEEGRVTEALIYLRAAVKAKPEAADWRFTYGAALQQHNQTGSAIKEFEAAIQLQPGHAGAICNLAEIFVKVGQDRKARKLYGQLLDLDPTSPCGRRALEYLQ